MLKNYSKKLILRRLTSKFRYTAYACGRAWIGEIVALEHSDFEGNNFMIRRTETRFTDERGKYVHILRKFPKSPHKIRKTYGSILLDNHVDNKLIMEQMGHVDILCTEERYHRNRKNIDRKSQIISEIPEFKVN